MTPPLAGELGGVFYVLTLHLMTVDDMVRLTREMGCLGVLAFEAGDLKVSFGQPAAFPLPVEKLESMGDEEEDLFFSSPVRPRSE